MLKCYIPYNLGETASKKRNFDTFVEQQENPYFTQAKRRKLKIPKHEKNLSFQDDPMAVTYNCELNGFGIHKDQYGNYWEGNWQEGNKNGYFKVNFSNGEYFEGEFVSNKRNGFGKFIWYCPSSQPAMYEGYYFNDVRHGNGQYHTNCGNIFERQYNNGVCIFEQPKFSPVGSLSLLSNGRSVPYSRT